MKTHKRISAASMALLALVGAAGCGTQNPSNDAQSGQPRGRYAIGTSKPLVSCISRDVYDIAKATNPALALCYDEAGNPVTEEQAREPEFWDTRRMGYFLTAAQSAKPTQTPISGPVEQNVAEALGQFSDSDAYLLDLSLSMSDTVQSGQTKWQIVAKQPFPKNADLYVFEGNQGLRFVTPADRSNLEELCCGGGTPLWKSLLDLVKEGKYKNITVLTDGRDDGYMFPESIIDLAKRHGTKINFAGPANSVPDLEQVAKGTNGQYRPVF